MIVAIASTKGGVGKTTIAVNLAVVRADYGRVLLVDGDEQGSAADFTALRGEVPGYALVRCHGTELKNRVIELSRSVDDTIIDVGGTDSGALRAALLAADLVAIPVLPRVFDVWATEQMAELVNEARAFNSSLRACAFLNFADAYGSCDAETITHLRELTGIDILSAKVGRRKPLSDNIAIGRGVIEARYAKPLVVKAQVEIRRLAAEIFK